MECVSAPASILFILKNEYSVILSEAKNPSSSPVRGPGEASLFASKIKVLIFL